MDKKGQILNQFGTLAIGVVGLMISLVVAFLVMQQTQTQALEDITPLTVVNESVLWTENQFTAFGNAAKASVSCIVVQNNFSGFPNGEAQGQTFGNATINSGNYTCGFTGINMSNSTAELDLNITRQILVTYSYQPKEAAYNATQTLTNATQDIPSWVSLIILAFIGALLLGLVGLFRRRF